MKTRTDNSISNIVSNIIIMIVKTIMTFITRTIFIKVLGENMLGLNGLFTNILSMLSLAELGISTAINFSLYKPLANKDNERISRIMTFYKKTYHIVGTIVFIIGILLIPFLDVFIKGIEISLEIYIIYLLYLLNTTSTYFVSYKETLIIADQKNYKLAQINFLSIIILNTMQILILILYKNFILYLIAQFFIQFIQKVIINRYITKEYNYINFKSKTKLYEDDKKEITKNVKAMFFHKIGDYCINGTDNLIISSFINITVVGIYSNYLLIINTLSGMVAIVFNSIVSSVGNLIALENVEKKEKIFNIITFLGFVLYGLCTVCMVNVLPTFISMWIGNEYKIDIITTILIIANFYLTGMRVSAHTMKSAAGLYDVDKYTPIIQSIINLAVSIVLVQKIGLMGVALGTVISGLALPCWQRPYLVYKHVLNKSSKKYFIEYIKYILIIILSCISVYMISSNLNIADLLPKFIVDGIISAIMFFTITFIVYRKTDEYAYIVDLVKGRMKKWKKI